MNILSFYFFYRGEWRSVHFDPDPVPPAPSQKKRQLAFKTLLNQIPQTKIIFIPFISKSTRLCWNMGKKLLSKFFYYWRDRPTDILVYMLPHQKTLLRLRIQSDTHCSLYGCLKNSCYRTLMGGRRCTRPRTGHNGRPANCWSSTTPTWRSRTALGRPASTSRTQTFSGE